MLELKDRLSVEPNPTLRKLGLANTDRVVLIHVDDVGMCKESFEAFKQLVENNRIYSASVMVPCKWFSQTAAFCRHCKQSVDMGVHLTLTSEWLGWRWGPISTGDRQSGIVEDDGCFPHSSDVVWERADTEAVRRELECQIRTAIQQGIDVTHLDAHMGVVFHSKFFDSYIDLAMKYQVPPYFLRKDSRGFQRLGFTPEVSEFLAGRVPVIEEMNIPLFDQQHIMSLKDSRNRFAATEEALRSLTPGITNLIIHPVVYSLDIKQILQDFPCRVADYLTFTNEDVNHIAKKLGVILIRCRQLRDLFRCEHL